MDNLINNYIKFISENKTERLCTQTSVRIAQENGYRDINTVEKLKAGDKVYYDKMGKSLILFEIGTDDISKGMNILGAHIDSPRLDAKQNPIYEDKLYKTGIVYLNTHYYGGIKKYQWVASPLAIYGVVIKADGTKVDVKDQKTKYKVCITNYCAKVPGSVFEGKKPLKEEKDAPIDNQAIIKVLRSRKSGGDVHIPTDNKPRGTVAKETEGN